jgi:hypothetical protein
MGGRRVAPPDSESVELMDTPNPMLDECEHQRQLVDDDIVWEAFAGRIID